MSPGQLIHTWDAPLGRTNVGAMSALTSENCIQAFPPTTAAHLQEKSWEHNRYKMLLKRVHVVGMWKLLYSISKALSQDISIFTSS